MLQGESRTKRDWEEVGVAVSCVWLRGGRWLYNKTH